MMNRSFSDDLSSCRSLILLAHSFLFLVFHIFQIALVSFNRLQQRRPFRFKFDQLSPYASRDTVSSTFQSARRDK